MSHSYNKIWLHVVFGTKYRNTLISPSVEKPIHEYMRKQLQDNGCPVRIINGMPDHVHLLFLQNHKMSVADIIKQVKGSSSHWVNQQDFLSEKFAWQTGYGAFSVSESQLEKVYQYISNQKAHHAKKTFTEEYEEFIAAHGLIKLNDEEANGKEH
ncbi:MAG: IS200/IS605 family transposase [Bacteroidetes bacterium]|nr:IS200/IS605 family transposase [Bacteroidota bacterium]